ncbi:zinc finger protein 462-like [Cebidichthys violaceus]|uniref:zinc finger protein 462-like n=1 Tax=Cebidichthys violaceus TaxID=271503 RepID=UPI0035CABCE2
MQEESLNAPTSGYSKPNQVFTQESPVKYFQCSHCILLFKSKVYLFEHLNKVHGCDVDAALREAGLKYAVTDKAQTDGNSAGDDFECRRCDFKARSRDVLNEHERQCPDKSEDVIGNLIISENPDASVTVMSANQHGDAAGAKEMSSVFSVTSTSKSKCTHSSSKDLKTYKRPLQTITKYFTVSSGSNGKPPVDSAESPNLLDATKGTIILKESPSSSSPNSSGVFKVTAKSMNDIPSVSDRFLRNDQLINPDLSAPKPKEQSRETVPDSIGKRTNSDISKCPAKRAKSAKDETKLPQEGRQSSSNAEFSFDISEDEGERKLVNGDSESSTVYYCKHCVYSDVSSTRVSTHYQNEHPYVRYNAAYIQDPSDRSATFRCLQCPVEFVSVVALKRHYNENHPEAPNVFTMQSGELGLILKCFLCVFTTNVLKALKNHYKESHPTHEVDNSLLYCRYSATECKEGSTRSSICEKPGGVSPESACTPCEGVQSAPSAQHAASTGADVVLYHCNTCKFSHKSVVVMHVHYQKKHPGHEITIDKIKQSACVASVATSPPTPDESPNSVTVNEKSAPQTDTSDSSKTTKNKAEQPQRKRTSDASKTHSESPKTKKAESTEGESKCKELPKKRNRGKSAGMADFEMDMDISPSELFYCQFCSYSSTNIKSVLGHHNAKHSLHALTCMEEIVCYSAQMQKKKRKSGAEASAAAASSDSKAGKQVEVDGEEVLREEDGAADASVAEDDAYACAENLFYCQKCNYGNPSVKGIANHQTRVHKSLHYRRECIIEHTAVIRDQIEKSKFQAKEFSFSTRLPLPLMNKGDEAVYFCHFCNYRQSTVDYVVRHYLKKHRGFMVKGDLIRLYTSMVRKKAKRLLLKTANQEVAHASPEGEGNTKIQMLGKSLPASAPPSVTASQPQRTLRCYRCPYSTLYVNALKKHIWKIHRANRSITDVLRVCFKQGTLQTGYHCDVCVFSHEKAAVVYEHYREQHPRRSPSLEYVTTRLYVGPDAHPPKKKKPKKKCTDGIGEGDGTGGSSPSQRSGQSDTKTYSCRACSFKGSSVSAITRHYRAVHPWSVKEDGSVLGVVNSKRPSVNRQAEDDDDDDESFESYQAPLEFEATESPALLGCPYCPVRFHTQHGLNTHCGMKHHEAVYEDYDEHQDKIQTRMQVFKCPHCTYLNTVHQGILSHCHMKHPDLEPRADSLQADEAQAAKWGHCLKSKGSGDLGNFRLRGYACETCQQICATQEKLNKHCEKDHTEAAPSVAPSVAPNAVPSAAPNAAPSPAPSVLKPDPEPLFMSKIKRYRTLSNRGLASQASFLSKKIYVVVKCQYCCYSCSTKIGLARHVRVHHKTASVSKAQDCVYKCVLCSSSYYTKMLLGNHYVKSHGRDSFLKYYAPVYQQAQEKQPSTSHDRPLSPNPENTPEACETDAATEESNKMLVYRCPTCPYVNTSYHGTLTHCQMKHPDLVARADELQTEEILGTNLVGCTVGKGATERGYICKMCPLIYPSMKKLKSHYEKDSHQALPAAPEHSADTETEKPADLCPQGSASEEALKGIPLTGNDLHHQSAAETNKMSVQNKVTLYKCHMCSYKGFYRRYLLCHYKKTHKLDPLTTRKLLQKYNKRRQVDKRPVVEAEAEAEEGAPVKCKKCPELTFDSSQLLVAHYSTFHSSDYILDFTVLSRGSKKGSTGLYRCVHCSKQMNGVRKLWYHLDCHRETARKRAEAATSPPTAKSIQLFMRDELLKLEAADELAQWNKVTPVQTVASPPSPPSPSPPRSKSADEERAQLESRDEHTCKQCRRTFMSIKGLRSHERSHAAVAALKKMNNAPTSALKHNINRYVLFKAGTIKPFLCSFCSYRTTVMGLWRCHFMKVHQDVMMDPAETDDPDEESVQRDDTEPFNSSEELNYLPEPDEKPDITEKLLYLEPPDVQRQLNHYSSRAQADYPSETSVQEAKLPDNRLLHCEFCNFNTGHLSSMRRHYLNRHGKKILRCKDCDFITGFRKTLEKHMAAGHSTGQSEPAHEEVLRCPFCLYQTKNKNNMIDHIVLHREERVVPIEVRRPKLSRYLSGVVFRCHRCTFSSGSADNLRSHMTRHDDVKPYKCRLCYFDCTWLSDLEAHLSDKHQVVRNHELVGQVSLDQLQARVGRMPEEEPSPNVEHHNAGSEDAETEEFVTDCNEVPLETQAQDPAENSARGETTLRAEEACQQRGQAGKKEESAAESCVLDLQCENAKPNAVQEKREQEPAQPKLGDSEDSDVTFTQQTEGAAEGSSPTPGDISEDVSICRTDKKAEQDGTVKTEDFETEIVDNVRSELVLLDERGSTPLSHGPKNQVDTEAISALARKNHVQASNGRPQGSFTVARHLLTLSSKCVQFKMSREESLGLSFTNCIKEQVHAPKTSGEVREPYGEMPVLENEYLKEEMQPLGCCQEEDESDRLEQKRDGEDGTAPKDDENGRTEQRRDGVMNAGTPHVPRGALAVTDGAAEVSPAPPAAAAAAAEEKPFACEFCGRNLMNSSDLERHIVRHKL